MTPLTSQLSQANSAMIIKIEESRSVRRASACIRCAGEIHVKVPRHWSAEVKRTITRELVERLQRKDAQEKKLLAIHGARQKTITITTPEELMDYVRQINQETYKLDLGKVAIGKARYHHLAQLNLQSKTMTVSAYCLHNAPSDALRYLIIHELTHYLESGHGPRFWAYVAQFVPDYRLQSRIMKAFHHQAVIADGEPDPSEGGGINIADLMTPLPVKPRKSAAMKTAETIRQQWLPLLLQ